MDSAAGANSFSISWTGAPLAQPAILLPCQYAGDALRPVSELALVAAILEDALRSLSRLDPGGPRRRQFVEARAWLLDDDRSWPFGFRNVCDLLGVDAAALRESIREHLEARIPPRRRNRPSRRFRLEGGSP